MWSKLFSRVIRPIRMIWYAAISCTFLRQPRDAVMVTAPARGLAGPPGHPPIFKIQFRNSGRPIFAPKFSTSAHNTPVFRTTRMIRATKNAPFRRFFSIFAFCRTKTGVPSFQNDKVSPIACRWEAIHTWRVYARLHAHHGRPHRSKVPATPAYTLITATLARFRATLAHVRPGADCGCGCVLKT